ncbi:MAG TPA: OmpA family protein [Polyangiaceae bacterium]|jgi:chemotaxis protein MotB|nr:OmpA family protein [Polyangiaceae bacterium]
MARTPKSSEANPSSTGAGASSRADWLPWFLSVFGASCALFVLVKGVLPARTQNAHLMERVSRLETAAQAASSERASLEQAKGHLLEQCNSAQAQVSSTGKEHEREQQAQQQARKDMSETFADQVASGDVWFEQRPAGLAIGIREAVLFNGDHTEVSWKGRRFLRAFAENLKHLPADQPYEVAGFFDPGGSAASSAKKARSGWDVSARRAASVARYLEDEGGIPGSQLSAAGFSRYRPEGGDRIELVLLDAPAPVTAKTRSPL